MNNLKQAQKYISFVPLILNQRFIGLKTASMILKYAQIPFLSANKRYYFKIQILFNFVSLRIIS